MWERFGHDADPGLRGRGDPRGDAFAGAALAVTPVALDRVEARLATRRSRGASRSSG
jgi:SHS2 domain-containing protein